MRLNTKFSIGDCCFKMFKNEIACWIVEDIRIDVCLNQFNVQTTYISYNIREENGSTYHTVSESEIFKTKKELIKSL